MAGVWVAVMARGAPHIFFPNMCFVIPKLEQHYWDIWGRIPAQERLDEHATVDSKGMFFLPLRSRVFITMLNCQRVPGM